MDTLQLRKSKKIATVVGATGLVGSFLLKHLEKDNAYAEVYAFSRSAPKLDNTSRIKWIQFPADIKLSSEHDEADLERLSSVLPEGNDFFSCLGTTKAKAGGAEAFFAIDYQLNFLLAKAAVRNDYSQYFLTSSIGADARSSFFYNRVKGELELAIKCLPFWSIQIFQPSVLIGARNENRCGERAAESLLSITSSLFGNAIRNFRPIEAETVAICMVKAARETRGGIKIHSNAVMNKTAKGIDIIAS